MPNRKIPSPLVAAVLAAAAAAAAAGQQSSTAPAAESRPIVLSTQPVYTQPMQRLQQAAQRLRESIQAMAQKAPGPEREAAIQEAQKALLRTQTAMLDLPPELRSWGSVSNEDYDRSVRKLMGAADSLRQSVQAMADQKAGPGRNDAIRAANQALLDTQAAMASAYDLSLAREGAHAAGGPPAAPSGS
jgi:hypothetical protein